MVSSIDTTPKSRRWLKFLALLATAIIVLIATYNAGWVDWLRVARSVSGNWGVVLLGILIGVPLWLVFLGALRHSRSGTAWSLWLSTPMFVALGVTATAVQQRYAPTWLVESAAGVQTVLQSLPATVIALFILAFTTLFVVVQQTVSVFSSRAPLLLAQDRRVQRIVARTASIAVVAVVASGKAVPDGTIPPSWLTSVCATLLVATVLLVYNYGRFATLLIVEYSSPRSFVSMAVEPVNNLLTKFSPEVGLVRVRLSVLSQSLRYALRRDDTEGVSAALEGLEFVHSGYVLASTKQPKARQYVHADGTNYTGWIGHDLRQAFVESAEEALRLRVPQDEVDFIVGHFGSVLLRSLEAGHSEESRALINGLTQTGMSPFQVSDGAFNFITPPAVILARGEQLSEQRNERDLAAWCLACWSMTLMYFKLHFGLMHPLVDESAKQLGTDPPWDTATGLLRSEEWKLRWANQLNRDAMELAAVNLEVTRAGSFKKSASELRTLKNAAYQKWLALAESLPTWAYDRMGSEEFKHQVDTVMANIDIVAAPQVKVAIVAYMEAASRGEAAVKHAVRVSAPAAVQRSQARKAFSAEMRPELRAVLTAMEADVGTRPQSHLADTEEEGDG